MNNTTYARMQADAMNMANNMMTQMVCAEKGIDYNQLMFQAQQMQINNIVAQEQNRQLNQLIKKHYQGDSFFGKIRDAFGGNSTSNMFNPTMCKAFPGFIPQQPMVAPVQPVAHTEDKLIQSIVQHIMQQPAVQEAQETKGVVEPSSDRIQLLEQDMEEMKQMLAQLSQALVK